MNAPDEIQRLRLLLRAYGDTQPSPEQRRAIGLAIARYLRAQRRPAQSGAGPVRRIDPIEPT